MDEEDKEPEEKSVCEMNEIGRTKGAFFSTSFLSKPIQSKRRRRKREIIVDLSEPVLESRDSPRDEGDSEDEGGEGDGVAVCGEGHEMGETSLELLTEENEGYALGFECSACKKEKPEGCIPALHCSTCLYDLCSDCAKEKAKVQDKKSPDPPQKRHRKTARYVSFAQKTHVVRVDRTETVETQREGLPVCMMEQEIMEAISENDVIILCGETGSGKTTQIPQFLYEAGYGDKTSKYPGIIGVTEPRRVAAVSTARRVAEELNVEFKKKVTYQVRFDAQVTGAEVVKFMTDGILLKECESDILLNNYSAIILDEAHERGLNTDVLLGLLSRIVRLRRSIFRENSEKKTEMSGGKKRSKDSVSEEMRARVVSPLKLIVMSATLRLQDLMENPRLFPPENSPKVIQVPARQHPVTVHFNRKTPLDNYLSDVKKKVKKIHENLPPGGILVFLTGKREIESLCRQLREEISESRRSITVTVKNTSGKFGEEKLEEDKILEISESLTGVVKEVSKASDMEDKDRGAEESESEEELEDEEAKKRTEQDIDEMKQLKSKARDTGDSSGIPGRLLVYPLYSTLPTEQQMRVFEPVNLGERLVVVATNVAETSLTIPGIRYVIDSGRCKRRVYQGSTGASKFQVEWISKAAAKQRAGRAGRTGPGHCYRVYSSAVFDRFPDFEEPEILTQPIDSTVLSMKAMGIANVSNFPFPTPPDEFSLRQALRSLAILGAIDEKKGTITPLGEAMSSFPLAPRFARMLVLGNQRKSLRYVITMVSSFAAESLFLPSPKPPTPSESEENEGNPEVEERLKREHNKAKSKYDLTISRWSHPTSDLLSRLRVVGAYLWSKHSDSKKLARKREEDSGKKTVKNKKNFGLAAGLGFQKANYLRAKSIKEVESVERQLCRILLKIAKESPSSNLNPLALEKSFKAPPPPPPSFDQEHILRQIICAGLTDHVARKTAYNEMINTDIHQLQGGGGMYECCDGTVGYIHPSSSLFPEERQPQWLVFQEIIETSKRYMKIVTAIQPHWLPIVGSHLCEDSAPLSQPLPVYDRKRDAIFCFVQTTFGPRRWSLPIRKIPYPKDKTAAIIRHFARLLLSGEIIISMKEFVPYLSSRPSALCVPNPPRKVT
ncbi:hypothetical protein AAMO2058_000761000 [Amorphochlora amoebiformis]